MPALSQVPQPRPIAVSADAPFAHANSGVTLPATLIGLPRTRVRESEQPQLDIDATYADTGSELTVYIYRTTAGSVPVWFDRATWAIETRSGWGTPAVALPATAIAPPGRTVASGLLATWTLAGGDYRGTGVALLPLGDWLVKLRYSTNAGDGTAVTDTLRKAIGALAWPATASDGPAAMPVASCPTPLAFKGNAKSIKADGTATLLGAMIAGMARSDVKTVARPPATWCRDSATVGMSAPYRANASETGYLLALSDAGRGISVGPSVGSQIMRGSKPSWTIDLILPGRTINYPPQDRLPAPARVLEVLKEPATSSAQTWGARQITLPSDFGKR